MEISQRMREFRHSKKLTQRELGDMLQVSDKTISSWETGRTYPDISILIKMSNLFHMTLDELLRGDVDEMKRIRSVYRYKEVSHFYNCLILFALFFMIVGRKSFGELFSILMGILILVIIFIKRVLLNQIEKQNNVSNQLISLKTANEMLYLLENPQGDILKWNIKSRRKKIGLYVLRISLFILYIFLCSLISKSLS